SGRRDITFGMGFAFGAGAAPGHSGFAGLRVDGGGFLPAGCAPALLLGHAQTGQGRLPRGAALITAAVVEAGQHPGDLLEGRHRVGPRVGATVSPAISRSTMSSATPGDMLSKYSQLIIITGA